MKQRTPESLKKANMIFLLGLVCRQISAETNQKRVNKIFDNTFTMMATVNATSSRQEEGKRATALRTVLNRSLEKTIQTCSYLSLHIIVNCRYDKIAQSLPTLATKTPDQLRYALDQSLTFLKTQVLVCFSSQSLQVD